jgi:hypothetical protein
MSGCWLYRININLNLHQQLHTYKQISYTVGGKFSLAASLSVNALQVVLKLEQSLFLPPKLFTWLIFPP